MYYEQGMTQQQIANDTGQSRIRISRILQQARTDGIVRITIDYGHYDPELEQALGDRYPGTRIIVSDSVDGSAEATLHSLGSTAAEWLAGHLDDRTKVAVGWGRTLRSVAEQLVIGTPRPTFVPLLGGQVHAGLDVHANSIAALMADRTGGTAMRIFAPAIAESTDVRDALVSSAAVSITLDQAAEADAAIFSIGVPFDPSTTIAEVGYYTDEEFAQLRATGAACDLISIAYFDADGNPCGEALTDRTVSITLDQLRAIPVKICVAGGTEKHEAIRIALGLGVIDVLVTDDASARALLAAPADV
ncbi:MAG: sugar-binding transcriptional regulator [Actinomycetaceae bacterium]